MFGALARVAPVPSTLRLAWVLALVAHAGCAESAAPPRADSSARPADSTSSLTSARVALASARPSAARVTSASARPADSAEAPEAIVIPSGEPQLAEWGAAREIPVKGSSAVACETKMVREWLRVMCVDRNATDGKPVAIVVKKGRSGPAPKGENLRARNDITTLIVQVSPGTDFEAEFQWENGAHVLYVRRPAEVMPARVAAFDEDPIDGPPPASATAAASAAAAPVAASASAEPALAPTATGAPTSTASAKP